MSVIDLFENCGYKLYANNDNLICYTHGDGKRIKFKLKQRKVTIHSDVDENLMKAIIKQCEELGWEGYIGIVKETGKNGLCTNAIYKINKSVGENDEMRKLRTL